MSSRTLAASPRWQRRSVGAATCRPPDASSRRARAGSAHDRRAGARRHRRVGGRGAPL